MAISLAVAAPSSPRTTSAIHSISYHPDIDGLRAIAVLSVIGFHAAPTIVPGGFVGVDVFFVISGFLISSILLRALSRGTFSFAEFYSRRAKRIFPSLIVVLLVVFAIGWLILLQDEYESLGKQTAAGAGFALNLFLYKNLAAYFLGGTPPLTHLWSLGVEEQFYLLWPLFVVSIWKISKGRLGLILLVAAVSFALNVGSITSDPLASFYLPTSRLWELATGGALAYTQLAHQSSSPACDAQISAKWLPLIRPFTANVRGFLGAGLLIISIASLNEEDAFPGWWALAPTGAALLIISAGMQSCVNRFVLAQPAMIFIGIISYPLYLWHWPLLTFAHIAAGTSFTPTTAMCAVVASFGLAFLTYQYVELPLRCSARNGVVALSLSAVLICCGGLGYLSFTQRIPSRSADSRVSRFLHASMENFPPYSDSEWQRLSRFTKVGNGTRHVLLIGDSNVFQYYARVDRLVSRDPSSGLDVVLAVRPSCALGMSEIPGVPNASVTECRAFMEQAVKFARRQDVSTVVIGAAWYSYFVRTRDWDHYGESAPLVAETGRALEIVRKTTTELVQAGKRVYLVLQIPIGTKVDPRRMIRRTIVPPGFTVTGAPLSRTEVAQAVDPIDARLREVAQESGAEVIDPLESLCDERICPTVAPDGGPIYHDVNHLLPSYVRDHVKYLDRAILDAKPAVVASLATTAHQRAH